MMEFSFVPAPPDLYLSYMVVDASEELAAKQVRQIGRTGNRTSPRVAVGFI